MTDPIDQAINAEHARQERSWEANIRRDTLLEVATMVENWRDENRASAAEARRTNSPMAKQLEGAATECHALAGELRKMAEVSK